MHAWMVGLWMVMAQWGPTGRPGPYGEGPSQALLTAGRMVNRIPNRSDLVFCAPLHDAARAADRLVLYSSGSSFFTLAESLRNTFLHPVVVADTLKVGCGWTTPERNTLRVASVAPTQTSVQITSIPLPDTLRMFRIHAPNPQRWVITALIGNTLTTLMYDPIADKVVRGLQEESRVNLQGIRVLGFSRTPRNEPVIFGYDSLNQALGFARYDADSGYFLPFTSDLTVPPGRVVDEADFLWLSPEQRLWAVSWRDPSRPVADTLQTFCSDSLAGTCTHVRVEGVPLHHPRWVLDPGFPFVALFWAQAVDPLDGGGYVWELRLCFDRCEPFSASVALPDTLAPLWMPVPGRWMLFGLHFFGAVLVAGMDGTGRHRDGWWLGRRGISIPTRYQEVVVEVPLRVAESGRTSRRGVQIRILRGRRMRVPGGIPVVVTDRAGRRVAVRRKGNVLVFPRPGVYRGWVGTQRFMIVVP